MEVPQGGAEGMIVTQGGRFGGYGFYVLKGKPVFLWNLVDLKRIRWEGPEALAPGKHTLEFDFKYDGLGMGTLAFNNMSGIGRSGTGVLKVDGKEVATQKMERTLPLHPAVGRELRRRRRHRHAGERRGLPGAVQVHRQARQADAHDRPAEAVARRREEADAGNAEQQGERVAATNLGGWPSPEGCPLHREVHRGRQGGIKDEEAEDSAYGYHVVGVRVSHRVRPGGCGQLPRNGRYGQRDVQPGQRDGADGHRG